MLGIGDIVMPGLLLCFVLRYDNYKKQANGDSCGASGPANISGRMQKVSYFHCTLIGYFVGKRTREAACDPLPDCPPSAGVNPDLGATDAGGRRAVTQVVVINNHKGESNT